MIKDKFLLHS